MDLKSFIDYEEDSPFPIQNLPFGIFSNDNEPRVGVPIGDYIIDLAELEREGYFDGIGKDEMFTKSSLNFFMSLGRPVWRQIREKLMNLFRDDNPEIMDNESLRGRVLIPYSQCNLHLPFDVSEFTDFYSSKNHAINLGTMFRGKDNALMPNWLHIPVGYHGRSSSVVVSGTHIHRPKGQTKAPTDELPSFGESKRLDFELEMGTVVGIGNEIGNPIPVNEAVNHIFGLILLNDWSARDIQVWEYVPLGPFLGKNFATSVSPWVVTLEALDPFKIPAPIQDPKVLPYLESNDDFHHTYDITLEVYLQTKKMEEPELISKSNFKHLYWTIYQQLAHHTISGANMRTGDLLGSGTISGIEKGTWGSMIELAWKGDEPIKLNSGEERVYLMDGDTVIMKGYCQGEGYRIGLGEVKTTILPAKPLQV